MAIFKFINALSCSCYPHSNHLHETQVFRDNRVISLKLLALPIKSSLAGFIQID